MPVAVSTLLPEIRIEAPGCPEPVLAASLYRKVREFFWRSEAWKYTYDNGLDWTATELLAPTPVAGTDIPEKTVVKRVDTIKYDAGGDSWDKIIPFKTRDELDRDRPQWRTRTGSTPCAWTHDNSAAAAIIPVAEATVTTGLLIRSVIAPVFTVLTDTLPDFYFYEYEDVMRAGILADVLKIPGRDWTDVAKAGYYQQVFDGGIVAANSRAESDFGQPDNVMSYGGI